MTFRVKHLAAYASSMLALMVFQILFGFKPFSLLSDFHSSIVYTLISQMICMGVIPFAVLFLLKRKEGVRANLRFMRYGKPKDPKSCLFASLGLMLLIVPFTMVFNALTSLILNIIGYKRNFPLGTIYGGLGDFFLIASVTSILPAIFEEFTHRGILLSGLENGGSEMSAVLLSAVCFGLMHMNPVQFLYAVVGGIVFGAAVTKSGSMIPAISAHFANNFISTLLEYSSQKKNGLGVLYLKLVGSDNPFTFMLLVAILALSVYGVIRILQYLARKTEKPISEKKLFGVLSMDIYRRDGNASLKENAVLIATMISQGFLLLSLLIWGIVK